MGSATKQKNGRYQRSVKIGVDEDGKPIRKFFTATTLREVDAMVAEFKKQQKQGLDLVNTDMTFAEMGHLWLTQYKCYLSGSSYRRYASILKNHLNPVMGEKRLQDLKPLHLKTIINGLAEKGYSSNTMAEIKQTAAQVLEAAAEADAEVTSTTNALCRVQRGSGITMPPGPENRTRGQTWRDRRPFEFSLAAVFLKSRKLRHTDVDSGVVER